MNDDRLKARIAARACAKEVIDLACAESRPMSGDASKVFWESIRDQALEVVPLPPVEPKLIKARPMTDAECREFEKEVVPFGSNLGDRIDSLMSRESGAGYLRWLADQTFIDDLRRYLANETIARQS